MPVGRPRPAQHPDPVCVEDRAGCGGARGLYAAAERVSFQRFQMHVQTMIYLPRLHFLVCWRAFFAQAVAAAVWSTSCSWHWAAKYIIFWATTSGFPLPEFYPHLEGIRCARHHRLITAAVTVTVDLSVMRPRPSTRGSLEKQTLHVTNCTHHYPDDRAGHRQYHELLTRCSDDNQSGDILNNRHRRTWFGAGGQFGLSRRRAESVRSYAGHRVTGWPTKPADMVFSKGGRSSWLKPLKFQAPKGDQRFRSGLSFFFGALKVAAA